MDHEELIAELSQIEKLSNQERLRLAHRRRALQLKKWAQYEKEMNSKKNRALLNERQARTKNAPRIKFLSSIMLLESAARNDIEEVRKWLESGVDPDVANEDGLTSLHQCCIDDNEEMMKLLVEFGANINSEDSEKWTPLHAASTCGHLHLVQYLVERGAKLLAVNAEGNMPYDICDDEATLDYIEGEMARRGVTQELIEEIRALPETRMLEEMRRISREGGDLEQVDADGATFLHVAAANGYYRVAEFLLEHDVTTDAKDKDLWQPIHAASCWGHIEVLELLVQNGADLNSKTKNGETPYLICEDPELKGRIVQLRNEQEIKTQEARLKSVHRRPSTNSRTQSIRRTSHRERGLSAKKDVAEEAQMLVTRDDTLESSPSPTQDSSPPPLRTPSTSEGEEEPSEELSLPPIARPSLGNAHMHLNQADIKRLEAIQRKSRAPPPPQLNNATQIDLDKSTKIPENNINGKVNNLTRDKNQNESKDSALTPLESPINNYKALGNLSRSGSREDLDSPPGKIDIHVQVTINHGGAGEAPSPMVTTTTAHSYTPTQPGTLSDLKKQRSLHYNTIRPTPQPFLYNGNSELTPSKYIPPGSPSLTLKKFAGDAGDIVGEYEPGTLSKCSCCAIC